MPGKLADDEPATSAEDKWRREVFYLAVDSVSTGITNRFSSSRHVFEAFAIFSPKAFPTFLEIYPTTVQVKENVIKFCETYKIDPDRCAAVLLSFATVFKHFNLNLVERKSLTSTSAMKNTRILIAVSRKMKSPKRVRIKLSLTVCLC